MTDVEPRVMDAFYEMSTDRLNLRKTVDLQGFSAEFAPRCESTCKRRRTDHDSVDDSRTKHSPSNSHTSKHPSNFRTQQSSSRLNREAPRSKHGDSRNSPSLLSETRHDKHRENTLTIKSLESMQALIQSKEEDDDSKLDQAEALPPSAGEISTRDVSECSLSEEKSSNDIEEELTDCISSGEEAMEIRRSDEANWTPSSLTTGSLDTSVQTSGFESSDNISCNNKLDLSSGSRSKTCPGAETNDIVNSNVVAATSRQHVQTPQVHLKSLAKQCTDRRTNTPSTQKINIDYKAGVKRKLAPDEDNMLLEKIKKKTQMDTMADMNMTIDDIQVSNNNERSVHDESTEDERVIGDNVKVQRMIRRRNKRYMKSRRDVRALNKMKVTKAFEDIRNIFRNLFGKSITRSESEEERTLLRSKYVVQEKSIDSCSTEARDSSDDDDMSACKGDIHTPVDDSWRDVKDKSSVKMEREMNPLVAADTENVIGKNGISMKVSIAKADTQEATKVAKVNMEEYISENEMRELLWTLQRNLMTVVRNTFKRVEQNDRWSSKVKHVLREIQKYDHDKSSFLSDKDANVYKGSNSKAALLNMFPIKLISDIKDRENNDGYNTVNLTLTKNDISSENTNTTTIDRELMSKKRSIREDGTCTVKEDSCENSASVSQFINVDSISSSEDDASNASTVIVNRSLTPTSSTESGDVDVCNVNEDFCTDTFANQSSTNTNTPQSLGNDTSDTDNEVQLEIKIKTKSESTSETFALKIPPSMRAKYIDNLKNNFRRMISEISSEVTTSANANRTEKDDASEGALNTNQVVTAKDIEAMSNTQQVSCDSNHATEISINRFLQKEDFQVDLRQSINDRENMMERNEAGNNQCVQSAEREGVQTASISAENSAESSAPVRDGPGLEKSSPRNAPSESREHNEEISKECITAQMQSGWSPPTSVNLTVTGTSDTTSSVTTVASPRVSQASPLTSTSFVTGVSASSSATACTSIGNLHGQHMIFTNEEYQLIDSIAITMLYNNMKKLRVFLLRSNTHYCDTTITINYAVYKLNLGMLRNYPTSAEEIKNLICLSYNMRNNPPLVANETNRVPCTSAQKSSPSVQGGPTTDEEIPHIRTQVARNTTLRMGYSNQATAVNEQRFENNTNNVASMLQQRQSIVNSSQHQFPSNTDHIVQLDPTIANANLSRFSNNANIPYTPQTNSPSTNINWQQSSDSTNNSLRTQQPGASTKNIEQQQSSNSTNNIPNISQPNPITTRMEQQQLSAGTNNISYLQQLSRIAENIERLRSSANINNIPQSIPATVNLGQQSSDSTNNIPRMPQSIPANMERRLLSASTSDIRTLKSNPATGNIEQQQSSANIKNIQYATNSDLNNIAPAPGFIPLSGSTSISQQQFLRNNPHTSHISNVRQRAMMEKHQQPDRPVGFQPSGNVSNVPRVPHSTLPILNANQTSQSTNVAVNSSREPLRDMLNVSNQQQFYSGYPEYPNFHMSLPGIENVNPHPSYVNLRNLILLPTPNAITSNRQEQERGPWMASSRTNSKGTAFIPSAQQLQQANFQQASGSTPIVQNIMPNYTNMVLTTGNARPLLSNVLINPQTQICQPHRMPCAQCNIPAYFISNNQPQTQCRKTGLNPLQVSAMRATYQHLNNAPVASTSIQQTPQTQKRKYTRKSETAKARTTGSHSELARQEIPENPVSRRKNTPQNSATDAGTPAASLKDASQKKATSPSHTRETPGSSAGTSTQVAQDASMKRVDNESAETSASRRNPAAKSFPQKRKVKASTSVVTEDIPNLRIPFSTVNISGDPSNLERLLGNNPSNSKSQSTAQLTPTEGAQGLSQSAQPNGFNFNLGIFTDIQKLIIQSHLDTYFQMSLREDLHILTKEQFKVWKSNKSLLRCFHDSVRKYSSKFEAQAAELTQKDEARLLLPRREQKESAGQSETTELRRGERLEKTIQCLRNDTKSKASTAESTQEDSSARPQDEELLGTSNSSKSATTEAPSSELVESPQRDEGTSTLCPDPTPLLEESNVPREEPDASRKDSTTRDGAEPDGTAESIKQRSAEQPSIDTEIKQSATDKRKEKPSLDVQQEQSDEIFVEQCEPDICSVDVIQHEPEKLENLSEDIIEISSIESAEQPSIDTEITQSATDKRKEKPNSDVQQEQSDEIFVEQCKPDICSVDVIHEPEKLENLSEDIIEISSIESAKQLSINTEITQRPSDKCEEKSGSDVQQEQNDEIFAGKYEPDKWPIDVIQYKFEKSENLSEAETEINSIDLCQSSPDAEEHHFEMVNEELMPKEKKAQVLEMFRDFKTSERAWYTEECGQCKAQSIDILTLSDDDEEEGTALFVHSELGTSNEQVGHSSETRHREEPQAFLVKNEGIGDVNIHEDIIIKDDILAEDNVTYNLTEIEDLKSENMLKIINICNISSTLYEKMDSSTFLAQDDQLQVLDEEENGELTNLNDDLEIVNEEDVPCLRCKRKSTVCCENCLAAYYCSERCSKLHWYSSHHKHCKPYNQDLPD